MDEDVWLFYLRELLKFELVGPKTLLVDNLSAHVSIPARRVVDDEVYSFLEPLPAKMRALWLREVPVISAAENRVKMIERTITAWESINEEASRKSFMKALPTMAFIDCLTQYCRPYESLIDTMCIDVSASASSSFLTLQKHSSSRSYMPKAKK
ncbi:hypothetical protein H310_05363 [Aphanomyces invadans]|uniref:DDE-1 domain-containing protein n=1 Tax=Aphanomyces invadans TaxID=157072 RepID=A0A024UAL7_9STRA|nr:hypothetical protein H310_05363 [Aphanomyces invadans]ETW02897.1 hypothetical protein H310_05363 [Aphanomyces invadans]|eukprot:XP_008868281.1 hypothetical protein H310_05363 [Aphanomyces invadans]